MDVVVLVKDVPSPAGTPPEIGADHLLRRDEPGGGLDPADEPGLAVAARLVEQSGGSVTAVSVGPAQAVRACRRALALGADQAVLVEDDALRGADALVTARVLARAIRALPYDLVLAGVESTDGATGAVPGALAELLGLPAVTFARRVEITAGQLVAERQTSAGYDLVACALPALVTLTAAAAEARHPRCARRWRRARSPLRTVSLDELGVARTDVSSTHRVIAIEIAPEREAGEVVGEAEGAERIVEMLDRMEVLG